MAAVCFSGAFVGIFIQMKQIRTLLDIKRAQTRKMYERDRDEDKHRSTGKDNLDRKTDRGKAKEKG